VASGVADALLGQVDADDQIGKRRSLHRNGIAEDEGPGGNFGGWLSIEGKRVIGAGLDRSSASADSDVRGAYGQRFGAEFIGELHAHGRAADADVYDIAIGRIARCRLA